MASSSSSSSLALLPPGPHLVTRVSAEERRRSTEWDALVTQGYVYGVRTKSRNVGWRRRDTATDPSWPNRRSRDAPITLHEFLVRYDAPVRANSQLPRTFVYYDVRPSIVKRLLLWEIHTPHRDPLLSRSARLPLARGSTARAFPTELEPDDKKQVSSKKLSVKTTQSSLKERKGSTGRRLSLSISASTSTIPRPLNASLVSSDAMQGERASMEDRHASYRTSDGWTAFGVWDGHGGDLVASICAEHMLRSVVTAMREEYQRHGAITEERTKSGGRGGSVKGRGSLHGSSLKSDSLRLNMARVASDACVLFDSQLALHVSPKREAELLTTGATACMAVFPPHGRTFWFVNVGDSRAAAFVPCANKEDGKRAVGPVVVLGQTRDHKPENKSEKRRSLRAGGSVTYEKGEDLWRVTVEGAPSAYSLSRAIGDWALKVGRDGKTDHRNGVMSAASDTVEVTLPPGTDEAYVIDACDGLWDVLTTKRACKKIGELLASTSTSPGNICHMIVAAAIHELHSTDNVSALLIRVTAT